MGSEPTVAEIQNLGYKVGLSAVGVTSANDLFPAAAVLPRRKENGLNGSMQFTYRNPSRSSSPGKIIGSAKSVVAGAYSYFQGPRAVAEASFGEVARYSWDDYYEKLRLCLEPIAELLRDSGAKAQILADSNSLVDRNVAWRSGIGWYGKNANLLVPEIGSWVVLGAVVTDAALDPTGPPLDDGCGACTACIDNCPTDAILAPGVVDARRCIAWIVQAAGEIPLEFRTAVGGRIYGCDECQEVCPPNRTAPVQMSQEDGEQRGLADLRWILTADDDELLVQYGRWYIADRDCDVIRRTALVAIGNIGSPDDQETVLLLKTFLAHKNPLLRSHAVWAARRLGLQSLLKYVKEDHEPAVRRELEVNVEERF